ncbi:MAG: cytochrome c [Elusimicrobiota bacterium]|nr:MAG: cytochrome c [Elusimicrobiota bacterium]
MTKFLLLLWLVSPAALRAANDATPLIFTLGDKEVLRVAASDMAKRPNARTIEIFDPAFKKPKKYRAVPVKDLLTAAFGGAWSENALGELFFDALDGYRSHAKVSVLMQSGGMIAFEDLDAAGWEAIPNKGMTPAPYYLVWTGPEQKPKSGYPWPWAVVGVKMAILEDEYPNALPKGAGPDSAPARGWAVFKRSCISCHSMSGHGGTVGPDLNAPRGITRYQRRSFLKKFIKQASAFRHTKMPDFGELEPKELSDLMAYFDHMSDLHGTK